MRDFILYFLPEHEDFFVDAPLCHSRAGVRAEEAVGETEKGTGRAV